MQGYSWLMARLPRRWALPITQGGMAALLSAVLVPVPDRRRTGSSVAFYFCRADPRRSCSSASSGRWPTRSTTRGRPSGSSGSSAAARASAASPARRWRSDAKRIGTTNLLLVERGADGVCAGARLGRSSAAKEIEADRLDRRQEGEGRQRRARRSTLLSTVAAPADHRAGHRLCGDRRGDHRAAAEHGGGSRQRAPGNTDSITAFLGAGQLVDVDRSASSSRSG